MTEEQIKNRIIKRPVHSYWFNRDINSHDSHTEEGEYNFKDTSIGEQIVIYVYAWNMGDYGVSKKRILKYFGITGYRLRKILNGEIKGIIEALACFSEDTELICGKAYFVNKHNLKP